MTRRRKQTVRQHLGNTCVPDDVGEVEWADDPSVVKAARDLAHRWHRWNAAKKLIEDDWRQDALKQIAAVTDEIETGLLLNKLDDERLSNEEADAAETDKYFAELAALHDRVWMAQAKKRLAAATRSINKDIARKERRLFHFFGR
jgi:hypothetical protein